MTTACDRALPDFIILLYSALYRDSLLDDMMLMDSFALAGIKNRTERMYKVIVYSSSGYVCPVGGTRIRKVLA